MEAYKVTSTLVDGTYASAVLWRSALRAAYAVGVDTFFDGEPGMAFEDIDSAERFLSCNRELERQPHVFRCDVDVSPYQPPRILFANANHQRRWRHRLWEAVRTGTREAWHAFADRAGKSLQPVPQGTVFCTRIRLLEEVQ